MLTPLLSHFLITCNLNQQVMQGPFVMREEPLEWYVNPTSKTWCCWSERACWNRQGRKSLQRRRGQFEFPAQDHEESSSATMQHAVEKAKTTANLEMTQRVRPLERSSEARFSSQQRELLSRPSTEATRYWKISDNLWFGSDNRGNKERRTH